MKTSIRNIITVVLAISFLLSLGAARIMYSEFFHKIETLGLVLFAPVAITVAIFTGLTHKPEINPVEE